MRSSQTPKETCLAASTLQLSPGTLCARQRAHVPGRRRPPGAEPLLGHGAGPAHPAVTRAVPPGERGGDGAAVMPTRAAEAAGSEAARSARGRFPGPSGAEQKRPLGAGPGGGEEGRGGEGRRGRGPYRLPAVPPLGPAAEPYDGGRQEPKRHRLRGTRPARCTAHAPAAPPRDSPAGGVRAGLRRGAYRSASPGAPSCAQHVVSWSPQFKKLPEKLKPR